MHAPAANNLLARVGNFIQDTSPQQQLGFALWMAAGYAAGALYVYAEQHASVGSGRAPGGVGADLPPGEVAGSSGQDSIEY